MTKRVADRFGKPFPPEATKWRKLRVCELRPGSVLAPSRVSALKKAPEGEVKTPVEAVYEVLRKLREEIVPKSPYSDCLGPQEPDPEPVEPPSYSICDLTSLASQENHLTPSHQTRKLNERPLFTILLP
ncbi:hypothetical protein PC110_g2973 [Phytophthora cactorum]|uniref:Uncharacterized protein n=1 Tax=Phytophthora cactorum TaxID=29920 RepID=A0A329SYX2_9STRA|nr:hypothetical protein PC110_g2973 [Phytophthora cactorum]